MSFLTIYSVADGDFLEKVLHGVAMISGDGSLSRVAAIGLLFSVLMVIFQSALKGGRELNIHQILLSWALYSLFFGMTTTVEVQGIESGRSRMVSNVPIGVAVTGSAISGIGLGLTEIMETGFQSVSASSPLSITEAPYLSGLKILARLEEGINDDKVMSLANQRSGYDIPATLADYIYSCVAHLNEIKSGKYADLSPEAILHFGNLNATNSTTMWRYNSGALQEDVQTCKKAYEVIQNKILPVLKSPELERQLKDYIQARAKVGSGNVTSVAEVFNRFGLDSQSAQNMMLSAVLKPALEKGIRKFVTRSEVLNDVAMAQGIIQRNQQWVGEAQMWSSIALPLMAFFEGFIYALTPFMVILIVLGTFGIGLVGKYLMTLFWVNLWMPILAISNLYITDTTQKLLSALIDAACREAAGLGTIKGLELTVEALQDQLAVGYMLIAATPMLALMVVSGSTYTFTTLASRLNGADHYNEKIARPDALSVGTVFEQQGVAVGNKAINSVETGMLAQDMTFSANKLAAANVTSARTKADAKMDDLAKNFADSRSEGEALLSNRAVTNAFNEAFNNLKAEGSAFSGSKGEALSAVFKTDYGAGVQFGAQTPTFFKIMSAGADVHAKGEVARDLSQRTGANITTQDVETLQKALTGAISKAAGLSKSDNFQKGVTGQIVNAASEAVSATKAYTDSLSEQNSLGAGTNISSIALGNQVNNALENGSTFAHEAVLAAKNQLGAEGMNSALRRAGDISQQSGVGMEQAKIAAMAQCLSTRDDPESREALMGLMRAAGVYGSAPSGSAHEFAGIRDPKGMESIRDVAGTNAKIATAVESQTDDPMSAGKLATTQGGVVAHGTEIKTPAGHDPKAQYAQAVEDIDKQKSTGVAGVQAADEFLTKVGDKAVRSMREVRVNTD